jgi:nucleoside-diphosphate-sugar epimerase
MMKRVFIFGAGYSGKAFAARNADGIPVFGTTRSVEKLPSLQSAGVEPRLFDGRLISAEVIDALRDTTHLIVSVAPGEDGDPVLAAIGNAIRDRLPALEWIGYLSTVGVYGDHGGAWVDERSKCTPGSRRSVLRLAAEQEWLKTGQRRGVPVSVLRLSGIYGPGRNAFVNLANGAAKRLVKPGQVFNRVHVDDIAGALWYLAGRNENGVFNVTDEEPAPPQDVVSYAAHLMGIEPPPEIPFEAAQLSPMARSFYGENKRVSNAAINAMGYEFEFPNYRAALDRMWTQQSWMGAGESDARSPMRHN